MRVGFCISRHGKVHSSLLSTKRRRYGQGQGKKLTSAFGHLLSSNGRQRGHDSLLRSEARDRQDGTRANKFGRKRIWKRSLGISGIKGYRGSGNTYRGLTLPYRPSLLPAFSHCIAFREWCYKTTKQPIHLLCEDGAILPWTYHASRNCGTRQKNGHSGRLTCCLLEKVAVVRSSHEGLQIRITETKRSRFDT